MSDEKQKPAGYIHPETGKIIVRFPSESIKFMGDGQNKRTFADLGLLASNEIEFDFLRSKFYVTRSGKFRARRDTNNYTTDIFEKENGELEFRPRAGYVKKGGVNKFFSRKIII